MVKGKDEGALYEMVFDEDRKEFRIELFGYVGARLPVHLSTSILVYQQWYHMRHHVDAVRASDFLAGVLQGIVFMEMRQHQEFSSGEPG